MTYNALARLQRKAELVVGYAAITGVRMAEPKLRTFYIWGQPDEMILDEFLCQKDYRTMRTAEHPSGCLSKMTIASQASGLE